MKAIIKSSLLLLFYIFSTGNGFAKTDTLIVKSSITCASCKKTIENGLRFEKGVKLTTVDVKSKTITVLYNPEKTTPEKVKIAITKLGYDADTMPADKKAYDNLEDCCKIGGHD
jgi:copper chaperone CopZ